MGHIVILSTLLVLCQGFNLKTRQLCCNLGTNYSLSGQSCKTFQTPIPDLQIEDEKPCLNTVDFCCKKQFRLVQCEKGQTDAKTGTCSLEEEDRKDCCEACQMGIETKKAGDPCIDNLGFGYPYADAFVNCCKEADIKPILLSTTTSTIKPITKTAALSSAEGLKYSKHTEDLSSYPGLSEENVCETGEFCAQLCEPSGKSFKCACFPGYELMKDGVSCKPIKSAKGSRCEKNNPCDHDCLDTGTAVECSCRKGYELAADKKSCKDIDECALGIHECEPGEECENDEGTYFCFVTVDEFGEDEDGGKCPTGHKFNAEKSLCDDVDECVIDLICPPPKVCKNNVGSFTCEGPDCPPGFYYKASIESCADIDECINGNNNCNKDTEICLNTKGNYTCVDKASRKACPPGFKKNDITFGCEDINECEDDIQVCFKGERCINEEGGYKCLSSTQPIKPRVNDVNDNNIFTTTRVYSPPSCPRGFKFNLTKNTCDDINECQLRLDNCSPMHRCDNTIGSFYCTRTVSCGTGYTLNSANDLCEDDDECALGINNCYELGPNYQCKNQMGTYRCELVRPTYRPIPTTSRTTTTTTVAPTTSKRSTASTSTTVRVSATVSNITTTVRPPIPITNVWGEPFYSYNKKNPWWSYPTSQRPYITRYTYPARPFIAQPTTTVTPVNNFVPYRTVPPSYQPPVTPKYTYPVTTLPTSTFPALVGPSRSYPVPFNPFTNNLYIPYPTTPKRTSQAPVIINGMLKKCLPGYKMNERGDCEDINECESNPCPRGLKCLNFNGRYECSSPLFCKIGFEPNEAGDECIDVNECSKGTHNCSKTQICKNGLGYYTCECPPGHHLDRRTQECEDIDECKYYRVCGNYANCVNTVGSYHCGCKSGFRKNQSFCDDINECLETPGLCEHNCVNIWGSYRCACKPGFTLGNDNRTCSDIDECEKFKDRKLCIGTCVNVPGSYECQCPKGYKLGNDKRVCIDIDECQHNICAPDDACVNTRGGYKCYPITCAANYVKDPNHKARCKRLTCDPRDNQCLLMPEQYSYQYMALVSNLPLSDGGIPLYKIKGPDWTAASAEFSLKLIEVNSPPGVQRVDESYVRKVQHQNNLMELNLVKSIQGPQEVKLEVTMKLFHGNNLIGSVVVYIIIVVSEYSF